jgi:hypothetical protein
MKPSVPKLVRKKQPKKGPKPTQIVEISDMEAESAPQTEEMRKFLTYDDALDPLERSKSDPQILKKFENLRKISMKKYKSKILRKEKSKILLNRQKMLEKV